jgi:hypothetical protein
MLARWGFIVLALAFLAGPALAQTPVGPVTPRACDLTTVATGGTAVNAIASGPVNGFYITNPLTLTDEGIAAAEPLLVNPVGAATAAANVNTIALPPGSTYNGVPLSAGPVSVNAVTSGHKFTCVRW